MTDHERIWLQHPDDAASDTGRMWCEDKVWPDFAEGNEPTEYVRADLYTEALTEIERLLKLYDDAAMALADLRSQLLRANGKSEEPT